MTRFLSIEDPFGEGFFPPLLGGLFFFIKRLLRSPIPAVPPYSVRAPHPGITDDREHTLLIVILMQHGVRINVEINLVFINECVRGSIEETN